MTRAQWQIDQGNACGCRGSDDYCPCQNVNRIEAAAALRQSPTAEEVAELMERMVSGPGLADPEMRDAQRADRLLCAQAIADLYGRRG